MGDPKKKRKHFERPRRLWHTVRLEEERKLMEEYGLAIKKELWRTETILRKKRQNARKLLAKALEERVKEEKKIVESLQRIGILQKGAVLDDVLSLKVKDMLERRLQTIVYRKCLAGTIKQARQFVVHGHIAVAGKKLTAPSYLVPKALEGSVSYYGKPMEIMQKQKKERETRKEGLRKSFEKAKPEEEIAAKTAGAKEEELEELKEELKGEKGLEEPEEKTDETKEEFLAKAAEKKAAKKEKPKFAEKEQKKQKKKAKGETNA